MGGEHEEDNVEHAEFLKHENDDGNGGVDGDGGMGGGRPKRNIGTTSQAYHWWLGESRRPGWMKLNSSRSKAYMKKFCEPHVSPVLGNPR